MEEPPAQFVVVSSSHIFLQGEKDKTLPSNQNLCHDADYCPLSIRIISVGIGGYLGGSTLSGWGAAAGAQRFNQIMSSQWVQKKRPDESELHCQVCGKTGELTRTENDELLCEKCYAKKYKLNENTLKQSRK
jgi:hypothetical protein